MSYFAVIVLTKVDAGDRDAVRADVARLLAPYDESGERFADGSRWDWWQIGGRFTGALDGYDPICDPENLEEGELRSGTGTRPDWSPDTPQDWVNRCNGCNGCLGQGQRVRWPTAWVGHDGDILPAREARTGTRRVTW